MKFSLTLLALSAVSYSSAFLAPAANQKHASTTALKNGMDEYDRQMRAMMGQATAPPSPAAPAQEAPPAAAAAPAAATATTFSGGDPIATLDASQKTTVDAIAAAIADLAPKPDLSFEGGTIAGCSASLDGRDAVGNSNVAWLAALCVESKESSLTIFNGPLTNVPHLVSRCCVVGDGSTLQFTLDFRPRAYGAYETKDAEGNYAGPDKLGRVAFEYSGNRMEFFNNFGTEEVVKFMESTKASLEGAVEDTSNDDNELDMLTKGPLAMSLTMPVTDANVAAIAAAREQAANYWLTWALDGSFVHRPGAPVNTQYVYDTKYKQNCYGALLPTYTALYGPDDGAQLTAAVSGPLDEAYVGGGS